MLYETVVFGNKKTTRSLVHYLWERGFVPSLVITLSQSTLKNSQIAGVEENLTSWCQEKSIPVHECQNYKLNSTEDRHFFVSNEFGLGVCTGWQRLVPSEVLDRFKAGVFGFHGSLLRFPNGRGRSPLNWSLRLGGDAVFHNCFRYGSGADEGPVFNTTQLSIDSRDTIRILQYKALMDIKLTTARLLDCYRRGDIPLTDQPRGPSVWLPKLTPKDSEIQFGVMPAEQILSIVRASSRPFDGATARFVDAELQVTIWDAIQYQGPRSEEWKSVPYGTILDATADLTLVKTRDGEVLLTDTSTVGEAMIGRQLS